MPQNQLSSSIDTIIEERGKKLRVVEQQIDKVNQISGAIEELKNALNELEKHPQVTEEIKSNLQEFKITSTSWNGEIVSALARLNKARNRCDRQAITIGCGGEARVGKSTLLQTIGNLPEEAVPTGDGLPVTAVRSRLQNHHELRAIITLRDKKSFIEEVIEPYRGELDIPEIKSFEDFRNIDCNKIPATDDNNRLLDRFKGIHNSLFSYEQYLTGKTKIMEDLTQLRPWVSYPQEQINSTSCSRLYLGVKSINIQCPFLVDVNKLMLVDLPGLGEVNVEVDQHHIEGLKNEVDLVLMLLAPNEESAFWNQPRERAYKLISKATEGLSDRGDFLAFVINRKPNRKQKPYDLLIQEINNKFNKNSLNSKYKVIDCNAKDPESVRNDLLLPILEHLIHRLPRMDQEIIDWGLNQWKSIVEKINIDISELQTTLRKFPVQATLQGNNFAFEKAKKLRRQLASELRRKVLKELEEELKKEEEEKSIIDNDLIEEINKKHQEIQNWADKNGLGQGKKRWYKTAGERFYLDQNVNSFATDEINRSRTFMTNTYTQLDVYFDSKMLELFTKITRVISDCTGDLIKDVTQGREALEKFLQLLGERGIGDPFPSLREATEYLLKCGTENAVFQSHLLPRLTEETQKLVPETFNFEQISYQNDQAPELVLNTISARIIQTSYAVQKRLKQNPFISGIRYSAAVKFEDSLLRDEDADIQFFNFASSYTNEIWSEEFQTIERNNHLVKKAEQAINNLKQLINNSL